MNLKQLCLLGIILSAAFLDSCLASPADEVLVVYNRREQGSREIAESYASKRGVPTNQVVGFYMPVTETTSRGDFNEAIRDPILQFIAEHRLWTVGDVKIASTNGGPVQTERRVTKSKIRYLVLCRGVPLRIAPDPNLKEQAAEEMRPELQRNEAAVDSELTCLPMSYAGAPVTGLLRNPVYGVTNAALIHPTNGVLIVSRLDGPTIKIASGLVDKTLEAESNGFWGRAYFDLRNPPEPAMKEGDDWIRVASEVCRLLGFETVVDDKPGTFRRGFPMSHIAVYIGWYRQNVDGPFLNDHVEFMPGAFAYHLHSFSAPSLRVTTTSWAGPLLAKGASCVMGTVYEPYLAGTPNVGILAVRLYYMGFTYGEAACASQSVVSWMTTTVGDPLFRPFLKSPEELRRELEERNDSRLEWLYLRVANMNLAHGTPVAEVVRYLENLSRTKQSAVLMEKLADLYSQQGKPSSAISTWQEAVALDTSPEEWIRLRLKLGEHLQQANRPEEAMTDYQELLKRFPHYPDAVGIYQKLAVLADKLNKTEEVKRYEEEIRKRTNG